jgi:hypothetical protein
MKRVVLHLLCVPADVLACAIVLFVWACWGEKLQIKRGVLCCQLKETSWPARTWYDGWAATTFGHAIMFGYGQIGWDPLWHHELVHVEQFEANCLASTLLFLLFCALHHPWLGLLLWSLGPTLAVVSAFATAWFRGEDPYLGSHLEEAARAEATCKVKGLPI